MARQTRSFGATLLVLEQLELKLAARNLQHRDVECLCVGTPTMPRISGSS
jgi:hypothetical protein